jgi:hypothetical protein
MTFRARFRGVLGAAALSQSENHVGQQQCVPFVLRHTIFRKRGFSQINVTTHRRSTSSTGASREPQTLSRELRAMGYRSSRLVRAITPRPRGRLRILKKLPRPSGRDRAREKKVDPGAIEIWFADEARIGQKNKITRRWARRVRCAAASRAVTTETPYKRESRRGRIPEEPLVLYEGGNSDALFSGEVQFLLDFLIVGLSPEEGLVTSPEVCSDGVCFKTRRVSISQTCRLVWQSE